MNVISVPLKNNPSNCKWLEKSWEKSYKFGGQKVWEPWNPKRQTQKTQQPWKWIIQEQTLSAGSCHYVTEMDLFCMKMVWTPKSHAVHHICRGWRVRKAKKSPESLFSINVAGKRKKKKKKNHVLFLQTSSDIRCQWMHILNNVGGYVTWL